MERPADAVAHALPGVLEAATSWVDAIQQASERIAELARAPVEDGRATAAANVAGGAPAARSWDLGLVLEAMRQEKFSDALAVLCALPPESQGDPDALLLRAVLLTNAGRLREAEEVCERLLTLDELNAGAHYVMALCREHAQDSAKAVEHGQTAAYLDPAFAMPRLHLGLMARRSGDEVTALRELSHALILLGREDASRLLLFGGGFSRDALLALCRSELLAAGDER
jgi:chemotaxis protein methyltransferase CheR